MDVLMPQLGETVAEGKITKWFMSAGDAVKPGDNLFEIETDKVSMEVPSTTTGVLAEIRVAAGEVAPVGAVVGVISDGVGGGGEARRGCRRRSTTAETGAPAPRFPPRGERRAHGGRTATPCGTANRSSSIRSSKCARPSAISARRGLPAASPSRRWRGGLPARPASICRACAVPARTAASSPATSRTRRGRRARRRTGPSAAEIKALYAPDSYEEVPLDGMRRTIAARLTQAATVPHFYLTADVEIDRLIALREEANAAAPKDKDGKPAFKLSLNDFVIRALALALQRVPAANAVWAGDRILRFKHSDIGVAVALDGGLITPIIRNAETKSLSAISAEMKELAARARDKKLQAGRLSGRLVGDLQSRHASACANSPPSSIRRTRPSSRSAPRGDRRSRRPTAASLSPAC